MKSLAIGHLATQAGVNLETVRFYERSGLLPKPHAPNPVTVYFQRTFAGLEHQSPKRLCVTSAVSRQSPFHGPFMVHYLLLRVPKRGFGSHPCRVVSSSYQKMVPVTAEVASSSLVVPAILSKALRRISLKPLGAIQSFLSSNACCSILIGRKD
jgi:MerR HTH family regulatory protein